MKTKQNSLRTSDILSAKEISELHASLEDHRTRILELYDHDVSAGKARSDEGTEDIVDIANKAYNREFLFALSAGERDRLREIEDALERLDAGTYGYCLQSAQPIPLARLRAVPWAKYTIEYQEMIEKGLVEA